ncbi:hypothetical protein Hdeb2414_s0003g00114691 [Helianthus debilis subsp. tardiflorus]
MMSTHGDDLDLLLSQQDRVLETPPSSPSPAHCMNTRYLSDDGSGRQRRFDASDQIKRFAKRFSA